MRYFNVILFEWKHFIKSPFKIIGVVLFIISGVYGLHNGANLYTKQNSEINKLNQKAELEKKTILGFYDNNQKGPLTRPWVDITKPLWAIRNVPTYHYKKPSPNIVYSTGQTEQYGFYKKIRLYSSPYDADMTKEIANPERIQFGALDFSFTILDLLPLLLLILLYDIKGSEAEQGFLPLILVQTGVKQWWMLSRVTFYVILSMIIILVLMFYGSTLTEVFKTPLTFWNIFVWIILYLFLWVTIYFIILYFGKNTISNTFQMMGLWLMFSFIIPASIYQWISIEQPVNLMTNIIDTKRSEKDQIYKELASKSDIELLQLYPKLKQTERTITTANIKNLRANSKIAFANVALKTAITNAETNNLYRNKLISKTYGINPLTFFQAKLNQLTSTDYNSYKTYRDDIQQLIDIRINTLISDTWNTTKINKTKYIDYNKSLHK